MFHSYTVYVFKADLKQFAGFFYAMSNSDLRALSIHLLVVYRCIITKLKQANQANTYALVRIWQGSACTVTKKPNEKS